jgi:hypothetical protein
MAEQQSTQTHPEFTWRFLGKPQNHPETRAIVILTNATSEAEARANCPGWELIFAARLPLHHFQEVRHA